MPLDALRRQKSAAIRIVYDGNHPEAYKPLVNRAWRDLAIIEEVMRKRGDESK